MFSQQQGPAFYSLVEQGQNETSQSYPVKLVLTEDGKYMGWMYNNSGVGGVPSNQQQEPALHPQVEQRQNGTTQSHSVQLIFTEDGKYMGCIHNYPEDKIAAAQLYQNSGMGGGGLPPSQMQYWNENNMENGLEGEQLLRGQGADNPQPIENETWRVCLIYAKICGYLIALIALIVVGVIFKIYMKKLKREAREKSLTRQ